MSWLSLIWKAEVAPLRRGSGGKGKSKSIQIEWHFLFNHFLPVPTFYLPFWNDKYHNWLVCKIVRLQFPWVMKEISFPAVSWWPHYISSTLRNNLSQIALKLISKHVLKMKAIECPLGLLILPLINYLVNYQFSNDFMAPNEMLVLKIISSLGNTSEDFGKNP